MLCIFSRIPVDSICVAFTTSVALRLIFSSPISTTPKKAYSLFVGLFL